MDRPVTLGIIVSLPITPYRLRRTEYSVQVGKLSTGSVGFSLEIPKSAITSGQAIIPRPLECHHHLQARHILLNGMQPHTYVLPYGVLRAALVDIS